MLLRVEFGVAFLKSFIQIPVFCFPGSQSQQPVEWHGRPLVPNVQNSSLHTSARLNLSPGFFCRIC